MTREYRRYLRRIVTLMRQYSLSFMHGDEPFAIRDQCDAMVDWNVACRNAKPVAAVIFMWREIMRLRELPRWSVGIAAETGTIQAGYCVRIDGEVICQTFNEVDEGRGGLT